MAKGGARPGAGRPKGSNYMQLMDYLKQEDINTFVEFLLANYMEDAKLMVWMGDHLFGKAPQALDVTSGGKPLNLIFDPSFNETSSETEGDSE